MRAFYTYILTLFFCSLFAQKHDYNWMMGNGCPPDDIEHAVSILDFRNIEQGVLPNFNIEFEFLSANTSISDSLGHLQFYCNGNDIYNWQHELMENGGNLIEEGECEVQNVPQAVVGFVKPESPHEYVLINLKEEISLEFNALLVKQVFYNVIDMQTNDGLGKVVTRKELIVDDYLNYGQGMVCQHANGRDWWLLLFKYESKEYYRFLITPDGVQEMGVDSVSFTVFNARAQVVYSPNGEKFAMFNTVSLEEGPYVDIFDFDRCEGLLSNHIQFFGDEGPQSGGAVFSPNSRFLYISSFNHVYQYDMWAEDIEASRETVGVYDGHLENGFWASHFHLAQLAPNNKIYITTPVDGHYLHVIHNPDEKGIACNVEQRGLEWPTWKRISLPNFPHYRMGALEGSPCDSLSVSVGEVAEENFHTIISPNPSTGTVQVDIPVWQGKKQIEVYDMFGRQLLQHILPDSQKQAQLDLHTHKGVLLINIQTQDGYMDTQKVIIQ